MPQFGQEPLWDYGSWFELKIKGGRADKKEPVGFICTLSAPLHSKVFV